MDTNRKVFDEQLQRVYQVTGTRTQTELAGWLGVRQTFVADAERRGKIPADWLLILMRLVNVDPEWLLTGRGERLFEAPAGAYEGVNRAPEDGDAASEREKALEAVRSLPSRILAEELLRRAVIAEAVHSFR